MAAGMVDLVSVVQGQYSVNWMNPFKSKGKSTKLLSRVLIED